MPVADPTFPLYPVFAFLGFVLSVIPLPWHLQAWNSGTCAFMIWVGCFCLVLFVNSLIWSDNAINSIPVWCDISSQIILAAGVGIPASTLCISRRLYRIISTQSVSITLDDKRRAIYEDLTIAVGLPVLVSILHIIVQPHRFTIFEEYGCSPATYNTLPSYFLYYMWPVLLGMVSFIYSSLTLRSFYIRRLQFNQILSSNSAINPSRYLRLMILALIDIMCTIPIGIYVIYIDLKGVPLVPWISWDDTHFDFGRVVLVPAVIWQSDPTSVDALQINRWLPVICAFIFFLLFGFAEEARKHYRRAFWLVAKPFGFYPTSEGGSNSGKGKGGVLSGLKNFKVQPRQGNSEIPVYMQRTDPEIPSARLKKMRNSISKADSRSTICFPDDDVELGPYRKSFSSRSISHGIPSSTSSTCVPHSPVTPTALPPSYVDSAYFNAASSALYEHKMDDILRQSSRAASWMTLPDMIVENPDDSKHASRPSSFLSYSPPSVTSHREQEDQNFEDDDISIADAYMDSRPTSPSFLVRAPTPNPFTPSELPITPPPVLAFHRPFSPPSVYPVAQSHSARNANGSNGSINGIVVTIHTASSREFL